MHTIFHAESRTVTIDRVGEEGEEIVILVIFLRGNIPILEVEFDESACLLPKLLPGRLLNMRKVMIDEMGENILNASIPPVPVTSKDGLLEILRFHRRSLPVSVEEIDLGEILIDLGKPVHA